MWQMAHLRFSNDWYVNALLGLSLAALQAV